MKRTGRIFVYLLAFLIIATSFPMTAFAEEEITQAAAASMKMRKTEGTVKIADKNGKAVSVFKDMRLYNGYNIETLKNSYSWIDLDSTKLIKMDADSRTTIQKNGKELDIILKKGRLFFNVAKPMEEDETLNIRTSTMAVGIRGTCGWIEVVDKKETKVSILEGSVQAGVINPDTGDVKVGIVSGGETVKCVAYDPKKPNETCDILRGRFSEKDVPGFVVVDIVNDKSLVEKIFEKSKTDVDLRKLTQPKARERLYTEQKATDNEPQWNDAGGTSDSSDSSGSSGPSATSESSATPESPATPGSSATPDSSATSESYTFEDAGKTLIISGSGNMEDYYSDGNPPWHGSNTDSIETVIIKSGVTSIGKNAFYNFKGLKRVEIPDSVESIGVSAFNRCSSLTDVDIPSTVKTIGSSAFTSSGIKKVEIPAGLQSMGACVFNLCSSLETVIIKGGDIVASTFSGCSSLKVVSISGIVNIIDSSAFKGCDKLETVTISSTSDCYSGTAIRASAFEGCSSLTTLTISSELSSVDYCAFKNSGITKVEFPSGVVSIGDSAFEGCNSLEEVIMKGSTYSIGESAFKGCSNLKTVQLPSGLNTISKNTFADCSSLTKVKFPSDIKYISENMFLNCNLDADKVFFSGTEVAWRQLITGKNTGLPDSFTRYEP